MLCAISEATDEDGNTYTRYHTYIHHVYIPVYDWRFAACSLSFALDDDNDVLTLENDELQQLQELEESEMNN